jgi:hypothetical protein
MYRTLIAMLLACAPLLLGRSGDSSIPLTVVLDIQNAGYSRASLSAMETEAQRIFKDTGMKLDWRLKSELGQYAEFSNVVVFTMTGSCNATSVPLMIDERGPLALTYTSNGEVLPFGEVRCDRVKVSLGRNPQQAYRYSNSALGVALGRVMAHELYHILSKEKTHTSDGVTQTSLRSDELICSGLKLDAAALNRINARLQSSNGTK